MELETSLHHFDYLDGAAVEYHHRGSQNMTLDPNKTSPFAAIVWVHKRIDDVDP